MNIIEILKNKNITYSLYGKNTSEGWVNIKCLFCNDTTNHLGINLNSGLFSCWKCGKKGSFEYIIKLLYMGEPLPNYLYKNNSSSALIFRERKKICTKINFNFEEKIPDLHKVYLQKRRYDYKKIQEIWKIKYCYNIGKFKYRIMIPYFDNNQILTYSGLSAVEATPKYLHLNEAESITSIKNCLYGSQYAGSKIVVCEGCLDVWRFGFGAISLSGMKYTEEQILKIFQLNPVQVFICFDNELLAQENALKLANILSYEIKYVDIIEISGVKDLDEMNESQIIKLRKKLKM